MQNCIIPCYSIPRCFVDHRCSSTLKASGFMADLHCFRKGRGGLSSVMFQKDEECYFCTEGFWKAQLLSDGKIPSADMFAFFFFFCSNGKRKTHNPPRLLQTWCQDKKQWDFIPKQRLLRYWRQRNLYASSSQKKPWDFLKVIEYW